MDILSDKIVTTRKKHNCNACGRVFDIGTRMRTQVNTIDGIHSWRECPTCQELLSRYPSYFDDGYNMFEPYCVCLELHKEQTPEDMLKYLNTVSTKNK